MGYIPPDGNWIGSLRITEEASSDSLNWRNHPPLSFKTMQAVLEVLYLETQGNPLNQIAVSPFASHQNMLILSGEDRLVIERLVAKAQLVARSQGMTITEDTITEFKKLSLSSHRIFFAGWSSWFPAGNFSFDWS